MSTHITNPETFYVIHPLDAPLEEKCSTEGLGPMELTRPVRASLFVLRAYLVAITLVLLYRTLDLANLLPHHAR
jgi:hypothetical protein